MAMRKAGFVKYAHVSQIEVLPPELSDRAGIELIVGQQRFSQMDPVLLDPSKFIYTRERAISAYERHGLNGNYDGWVEPELIQCHSTFIHVPRYVDHDNTDPSRAIGIVLDAKYHPLDDSPQSGWVETISARDRARMAEVQLYHLAGHPNLLEAVQDGMVTDVSMGCFVDESVCTICGNKARDVVEYCEHVATMKGAQQKISAQSPLVSMGAKPGDLVIVGELNYGVTFFELSDITTQVDLGGGGADIDAKILERLAKKAPSGWERHLVNRTMGADLSGRQANGQRADVVNNGYRFSDNEVQTMKRKKVAQEASDPSLQQNVIDSDEKITQESQPKDYPEGKGDKDKALFDQSQETSPADLDQVVIDKDDKVSQESDADDYPHPDKMGKRRKADFIPTSSDPANTVGGKPDEVKNAEDEMREEKFEAVEDKLEPGDASETESEMYEEMDEEDTMMGRMEAALNAISPKLRDSERVAQKRDVFENYLDESRGHKKRGERVRSKRAKIHNQNKAQAALNKAHACLRDVLSYGTEPDEGGNPQALVDIDNQEQGDPDAALLDQSQGKSEPAGGQAQVPSDEDVAQVERPDHPLEGDGKTLGMRRFKAVNFDSAVDEMAERLAKGEDFETVQDEVFDQYGEPDLGLSNRAKQAQDMPPDMPPDMKTEMPTEIPTEMPDMAPTAPQGGEEMVEEAKCKKADTDPALGDEYVNVEDETRGDSGEPEAEGSSKTTDLTTLKAKGRKLRRRKKAQENEEELNDAAGETKTELSTDVKEDAENDSLIGRGTAETKAGPLTRGVTNPSSELIQLSASRARLQARLRAKKAQDESVETRMDEGTDLTKASPSTTDIADGQNAFQEEKTETQTKGQDAEPTPAVLSFKSGQQLMAYAIKRLRTALAGRAKENLQLRSQNERYQRRTDEVCRAWKWDQCRRLAMTMMAKGSFRVDQKTSKQRAYPEQKKLAYDEAKALMRLTNDEIESRMKFVGNLPDAQTLIPRWRKEIQRPHPQSVKQAGAQQPRIAAREDIDESLFMEDPDRGF